MTSLAAGTKSFTKHGGDYHGCGAGFAVYPSTINVTGLGNYQQCLESHYRVVDIRGRRTLTCMGRQKMIPYDGGCGHDGIGRKCRLTFEQRCWFSPTDSLSPLEPTDRRIIPWRISFPSPGPDGDRNATNLAVF